MAATLKNNQLERFINEWELVLSGMNKAPEEGVIEVLFLRQLRQSSIMNDDVREYDKLEFGHKDKSYTELKRAATRAIERRRLQLHRDSTQQFLARSYALPTKGKGKGMNTGTGKGDQPTKTACRLHLKGKCKAGKSCGMVHTPPCRFFGTKQGCKNGDACMYPHVWPAKPEDNAMGNSNRDPRATQNNDSAQIKGAQNDKTPSAVAAPAMNNSVGKPTPIPIMAVMPGGFGRKLDSGSDDEIH